MYDEYCRLDTDYVICSVLAISSSRTLPIITESHHPADSEIDNTRRCAQGTPHYRRETNKMCSYCVFTNIYRNYIHIALVSEVFEKYSVK